MTDANFTHPTPLDGDVADTNALIQTLRSAHQAEMVDIPTFLRNHAPDHEEVS